MSGHNHTKQGRSISDFSSNYETSLNSNDSSFKNDKEPILERVNRNSQKINIRLASIDNQIMEEFQEQIFEAASISISTKKKLATESPLIGKSGYLISIKDEKVGILLSEGESVCFGSADRSENDPLNFCIIDLAGNELFNIQGLDYMFETEEIVLISVSSLRTLIGKVIYGYVGADGETLSKATVLAGRDDNFPVPMSVVNSKGNLLFIFRREPDDLDYTEILTADGSAITIAEVLVNYKLRGKKSQGTAKSFSIDFIESVGIKEKMLLIGVTVVLFNQWLTHRRKRKICCSIT